MWQTVQRNTERIRMKLTSPSSGHDVVVQNVVFGCSGGSGSRSRDSSVVFVRNTEIIRGPRQTVSGDGVGVRRGQNTETFFNKSF